MSYNAKDEEGKKKEPTALDTTTSKSPASGLSPTTNFLAGFRTTTGPVWYPDRSYFRVDIEVLGSGDPTTSPVPKLSDQVALAEGAVNNAFVNAYFRRRPVGLQPRELPAPMWVRGFAL